MVNHFHILCLNETRLDCNISDGEVAIDGYTLVRKDRNRNGGGVAVYINNNIPFTVESDFMDSTKEMIWLQSRPDKENCFYLACLYRPPSTSKNEYISYLIDNITNVMQYNLNIIVTGDLNIDCSNVNDHTNQLLQLCQL